MSKYPIDVWVDKKTNFLAKMALTIEEGDLAAKLNMRMYDYNQDISIEKPDGVKSLLELLGDFAPLLNGAGLTSYSKKIDYLTDDSIATVGTNGARVAAGFVSSAQPLLFAYPLRTMGGVLMPIRNSN